jgi:hypothetical protein
MMGEGFHVNVMQGPSRAEMGLQNTPQSTQDHYYNKQARLVRKHEATLMAVSDAVQFAVHHNANRVNDHWGAPWISKSSHFYEDEFMVMIGQCCEILMGMGFRWLGYKRARSPHPDQPAPESNQLDSKTCQNMVDLFGDFLTNLLNEPLLFEGHEFIRDIMFQSLVCIIYCVFIFLYLFVCFHFYFHFYFFFNLSTIRMR